jgi:hypothetical protein
MFYVPLHGNTAEPFVHVQSSSPACTIFPRVNVLLLGLGFLQIKLGKSVENSAILHYVPQLKQHMIMRAMIKLPRAIYPTHET